MDFSSLNLCSLLPTGKEALQQDFKHSQKGLTYKWKIGVEEINTEIEWLEQLLNKLPENALLRLDANGGLDNKKATVLLQFADTQPKIEFIEQPLPPGQFDQMVALQQKFETPLALDESVANINQLIHCYEQGWRSVFVVKAAIAGCPSKLRSFCQQKELDLVFSSVFATDIGRNSALKLAKELGNPHRAMGFGTKQWFE